MKQRTQSKTARASNGARPSRPPRAKDRKVYVGFWTRPDTKKAVFELAALNRQSASMYLDGVVEEHVLQSRRARRRF